MRQPTDEEVERYHAGELQSVELTEDSPWEPYSTKFAEREVQARKRFTLAVRVTRPRPHSTPAYVDEAEEEDSLI